ncbi:MAG TPA: DUF547 domain-containing protein [Anaerohalosphaeraceae bacterium]|jgi:hypothetical protein|nr:DUF547 domain-containing protein [Anaerohalosphaeraceae bacterium]HRT50119.1 DUF547 domain-containing protein [Anaerohalosphaeraceae bacterium]HRT86053.1 DUF547 domain-containing protein [Anaerohalosphaeraceae bacterium]
MKKYLLIVAALVIIACPGCQPKEQDGGIVAQQRISELPLEGPAVTDEGGDTAEAGEGVPETPTEVTALPQEAQAPSEEMTTAVEEPTDTAPTEEIAVTSAPREEQKPEEKASAPPDEQAGAEAKADEVEVSAEPAQNGEAGGSTAAKAESEADTDNGAAAAEDFELLGPRILTAYGNLLRSYVDEHGNVDYPTLRRKRGELYAILRDLDKLDPREYFPWGRNEKIAFWINAYNLFTLKVVVENYPIEPNWAKVMLNYPKNSIVHINAPWTKQYFKVMGMQHTLREIERSNLLARYGDLRVCMALSYASMGGAMLRNEPYRGDKLDEQLDDQVRRFLADKRGFQISDGTVCLADIFNWYKQDFIRKYGEVRRFREKPEHIQAYLNFIVGYVSASDAQYLETRDYTVEFRKYDWRLNEQTNK